MLILQNTQPNICKGTFVSFSASDWSIALLQTQHKIEMDKRDGLLSSQPMAVPPPQQMSRVGYWQGHPQGYPPQGYNSRFQPKAPQTKGYNSWLYKIVFIQ